MIILGVLHIEMATLNLLGDWLEDSGWTNAWYKLILLVLEQPIPSFMPAMSPKPSRLRLQVFIYSSRKPTVKHVRMTLLYYIVKLHPGC